MRNHTNARNSPSTTLQTFSIGHINANRLNNYTHFTALETEIFTTNYDALAISETFLNDSTPDSHLQLEDFNLYRHDRTGKEGGGVALYVKKQWKVQRVVKSPQVPGRFENKPEYMICELSRASKNILIVVVYRRPKAAAPHELFQALGPILSLSKTVIITGDFNANIAAPASPEGQTLMNMIKPFGLKVVSLAPTHHTYDSQTNTHSHTTLDLFIVGRDTAVNSFSQSSAPFIAGHDMIRLQVKLTLPKPPPQVIVTRQLSKVDKTLLNATLSRSLRERFQRAPIAPQLDFAALSARSAVEVLEEAISSAIGGTFDALAPVRTITIPYKRKPWVTTDILQMMKDRDKAHKVVPYDHENFKALRSRVSNALDSAKSKYIAQKLSTAKTPKQRWSTLRSIGTVKPKTPPATDFFTADELSNHFSTIVSRHPALQSQDLVELLALPQAQPEERQFHFREVTMADITTALH